MLVKSLRFAKLVNFKEYTLFFDDGLLYVQHNLVANAFFCCLVDAQWCGFALYADCC